MKIINNFDLTKLKYQPKLWNMMLFSAIVITALILFWGRKEEFLRSKLILGLLPSFYQHISNFTISVILLSGIGYMWLMQGVQFKYIVLLSILIICINLIYELWLSILNTPDIIDAYFGIVGAIIGLAFLLATKSFGLNRQKI